MTRVWMLALVAAVLALPASGQFDLGVTDATVSTIPAAGTCGGLSATETLTVDITNTGGALVPPFALNVSAALDGGTPVVESVVFPMAGLAAGQTISHVFATTFDLSLPGTGSFVITINPMDMNPANDTLSFNAADVIASFPYIETFDNHGAVNGSTTPVPPGWYQDPMDGGGPAGNEDWFFRNSSTSSFNTGPTADHTTGVAGQGFYAYVEDSATGGNHPAVNFLTPCIDTTGKTGLALRFWVHSNEANGGTAANSLDIDVLTYPGPVVFTAVCPQIGHLGNSWMLINCDLSMFDNSGIIRIQFRVDSNNGTFTHDIAIDDVSVYCVVPTSGQAPQPGLSTLDINNAQNANGFPVPAGPNGPYFANATVGSPLTFTFEGEPFQVIVLLAGTLNVGVLSFPPFGQLDIGGVDPMGLPTGIQIIGSASDPGFVNTFFRVGPNGTQILSASTPPLLAGTTNTYQAAIFNTIALIGLSNAVELTIP